MSKRSFTWEQIEDLLKNKNVVRCSDKVITYSNGFKIKAIKQYRNDGLPMLQIFKDAGFDLNVIGEATPKHCIKDWNRLYKEKGINGLSVDNRGRAGGRRKVKGLTDAERVKRLEAEVAYLKAENDFLAKLRGGKTE